MGNCVLWLKENGTLRLIDYLDGTAKPEENLLVESKNDAVVVGAATEVPPTENAPEVSALASFKPTTHEVAAFDPKTHIYANSLCLVQAV